MGPGLKPGRDVAPESSIPHHAQLIRLREELEMGAMKIAQLQARLITTLDELDNQRDAHQRELSAERRAKEKLSKTLDGYLDEVKRAERERDEMRELVSILVEKVEKCSNLSVWPCSRLDLACPLGSYPVEHTPNRPLATWDPITMETAIVTLLRMQLEEEKSAHARTKQEKDAEIVRLRAMIARRDAELEACATHDAHRVLLSSSVPSENALSRVCTRPNCANGRTTHHHSASEPEGKTADADSILARATSRNRILEREIDLLRQNVHQVQHSQSLEAKTDNTNNYHRSRTSEKRDVSVQAQTSDPVHDSEAQYALPPSPELQPHTMLSSPTPFNLTPRHPRTPARTHSTTHVVPSNRDREPLTRSASIEHLRRDVDVLSLEIDDFVVERAAVKAMLARELPKALRDPPRNAQYGSSAPEPPAHAADECARERQELREQLNAITREQARRERELEAEIASLRQALVDLRRDRAAAQTPLQQKSEPAGQLKVPPALSPRVSPTLVPEDVRAFPIEKAHDEEPRAPEPQRVEGDHQRISEPEPPEDHDEHGERSMELASPLQTTTILSLRDDDWPMPPRDNLDSLAHAPPDVDPADVPLPTSPDIPLDPAAVHPAYAPSPPLGAPSSPSPPPLFVAPPHVTSDLLARLESATHARVASIEREIAAAHRALEDKEAALAGVRATAARLHSELDTRPADARGQ